MNEEIHIPIKIFELNLYDYWMVMLRMYQEYQAETGNEKIEEE